MKNRYSLQLRQLARKSNLSFAPEAIEVSIVVALIMKCSSMIK
jgi:hypothetical protein